MIDNNESSPKQQHIGWSISQIGGRQVVCKMLRFHEPSHLLRRKLEEYMSYAQPHGFYPHTSVSSSFMPSTNCWRVWWMVSRCMGVGFLTMATPKTTNRNIKASFLLRIQWSLMELFTRNRLQGRDWVLWQAGRLLGRQICCIVRKFKFCIFDF